MRALIYGRKQVMANERTIDLEAEERHQEQPCARQGSTFKHFAPAYRVSIQESRVPICLGDRDYRHWCFGYFRCSSCLIFG